MNKLITIENNTIFEKYYCSKKVLTGWDIAKIHSFEIKKVMDNFRNNVNNFIEYEDYFVLTSEEFKNLYPEEGITISNRMKEIILFTFTGYLLISRTFNDEKSWNQQRILIKSYFKLKELSDRVNSGELIIENKNTADKEKINILMKAAELTTDETLRNNMLSEIALITTGKHFHTSENTLDYDTQLKLEEIERIRNTPIEKLVEEENRKFMTKIESYPTYAKNKILIFPDHNNNITILDYIHPNSYTDTEMVNVMKNAYGINISRTSFNTFCEKFQLKNDKFGYVYYNPDKKTANFRFYMEIADELLKCLCNNPYSRKKYNLSTAYYDKHKK